MRTMKIVTILPMLLMAISMSAFAQTATDVSDEELGQFASAFQQVQVIDQSSQQEMVKAVEEKNLTVQRYNEIQQATQDPSQQIDATDEELKRVDSVSQGLELIQVKAQEEMQATIIGEGLTVERYQQIIAAIQSDPELQQKIQEYLQS